MNLTCVHTGWVYTVSVRNNAHTHVLSALKKITETVPFEVVGLDFDNGGEFLNHAVIDWAAEKKNFFTRSRPYQKNDQATTLNRPGESGELIRWKDHSHGTSQQVPDRVA